ncbi:unnamed protein product [Urochloa humidicola]
MADDDGVPAALCCFLLVLGTLATTGVLVAAYGFVEPVRVSVEAAALGSLALAAVPAKANNGTASFAYDVSVGLWNDNWKMHASLTAPLVAEIRFRGHAFARAQLAAADRAARIPAMKMEVYSMAGLAQSALGPRDAAAFATERAVGVFHLELAVSGQVKYEGRPPPLPRHQGDLPPQALAVVHGGGDGADAVREGLLRVGWHMHMLICMAQVERSIAACCRVMA